MEQTNTIVVDRFKSSIEVGTPAKGGAMKVYYDATNLDEAKKLVDNAAAVLSYANSVRASVEVPK